MTTPTTSTPTPTPTQSPVKLYHFPISGPSRGALLAARCVGAPVEVEIVNTFKKEQLDEKFLAINPQHLVPTLVDDGFALCESRAIASYLAGKFGKDDHWYPRDLKSKAVVDQRLYFDASSLYTKIRAMCFPILFHGETKIKEQHKNELNTTLSFLNQFLSKSKWVAGDAPTIADAAIYASVTSILAIGWDISSMPDIHRWLKDCAATLPGAAENDEGANAFGEAVKKKLKP